MSELFIRTSHRAPKRPARHVNARRCARAITYVKMEIKKCIVEVLMRNKARMQANGDLSARQIYDF